MRLALQNFLVLTVLSNASAYHRGTLNKGQDRQPRRIAKVEHEKKHYTVGDLRVHVSPKSGEIAVSRAKMGKKKDKASTVKILIKSIREVNAEGIPVGNGEGEAEVHSFASLKDTEFDIAVEEYNVPIEIEDDTDADAADANGGETHTDTGNATNTAPTEEVTESPNTTTGSNGLRRHLNGTSTTSSQVTEEEEGGGDLEEEEEQEEENAEVDPPRTATEGGAEGANVTLSAMLQTESDIRIEMWLISSGGAVGTTSEQWAVRPGDTKFNIQLTHWTFCDPCTDGTGKFVDVQIQIKGKKEGGPKPKEKGARIEDADRKDGKGKKDESDKEEGKKGKKHRKEHAWDLGEGTTLDLTSRVRVDGLWTSMPEGFPKFVNEGEKQYYTLRFPRFTDNIWYDPVVSFDEDFDSATSAAISRFVSHTATCGAMLLAYTLL